MKRRAIPRCAYCGSPAGGLVLRVTVCPSHADLPPLDPHYAGRRPGVQDQWRRARAEAVA